MRLTLTFLFSPRRVGFGRCVGLLIMVRLEGLGLITGRGVNTAILMSVPSSAELSGNTNELILYLMSGCQSEVYLFD